MTKHTPWETCQEGIWIRPVGKFNIIADVRFGYDVSHDDARKTATDIVRAVNSHEQLVAALEGLLEDLEQMISDPKLLKMAAELAQMGTPLDFSDGGPNTIKAARAALAAAKGGLN